MCKINDFKIARRDFDDAVAYEDYGKLVDEHAKPSPMGVIRPKMTPSVLRVSMPAAMAERSQSP